MPDKLNRGEIVEKRVKEFGISNTKLAERMGYTRQAITDWFKKEDLAFDTIQRVGQVIRYDFSQDIPELQMYRSEFLLSEPPGEYGSNPKVLELKGELEHWKTEAYVLAKELSQLKDKYYSLLLANKTPDAT